VGSWGTALYDSDITLDLKGDFKDVVRAPWDGDRLLAWVVEKYPAAADPEDSDYVDLRLAVADLFWTYGIKHPPTLESALTIIENGTDVAVKRELGMREADLRRREHVLRKLAEKWRLPNSKPRRRNILKRPEEFLLDIGDCLVYPTTAGVLRNPYVTPKEEGYYGRYPWNPDGWGAAVVVNRHLKYGVFSRYIVALLANDPVRKPDFADFHGLSILHTNRLGRPWRRVHAIKTTALHLKRLLIEVVGRLALDEAKLFKEFDPASPEIARGGESSYQLQVKPAGRLDIDDPIARFLASD
jgi:hypothetical protein